MNTRRKFLTAGGAVATLSALPFGAEADPQGFSVYVTGMVWNRQLATPMNDWLIRVYAAADLPSGGGIGSSPIGFATIGDDFHAPVSSHVELHSAILQGDQLAITGAVTESNTPSLVGQPVLITGWVQGTAVQGLTVTIGGAAFGGAGIIAVLIGLLLPAIQKVREA
jgi:hypothetical protein